MGFDQSPINKVENNKKTLVKNIGEILLGKYKVLDKNMKDSERLSKLDFSELRNITKTAFEEKDLDTLEEVKKINDSFAVSYSVNLPEDIKAMLPWHVNNQYEGQKGREWLDNLS
ncbi:MAG TPA: hypothetical protein PLO44_03075 [Candidatus Paceibacterota bacterium]|nr:hypothetical protein [Candidatus Paceibacterota bacterium]